MLLILLSTGSSVAGFQPLCADWLLLCLISTVIMVIFLFKSWNAKPTQMLAQAQDGGHIWCDDL